MEVDLEWGRSHGGFRQRLAAARAANTITGLGRLAMTLLMEWAWGILSAIGLQRICQAAVNDGHAHPAVEKLASVGTHGLYPASCHRDILKKFPISSTRVPEPLIVKIPLLDTKVAPPAVAWVDFPIFLAQDLMS